MTESIYIKLSASETYGETADQFSIELWSTGTVFISADRGDGVNELDYEQITMPGATFVNLLSQLKRKGAFPGLLAT